MKYLLVILLAACGGPIEPVCHPGNYYIEVGPPDHYVLCDQDGQWQDAGVAP